MKAITLYEANDGVRFELECDCVYHEAFCDKVEEINKRLRKNEEIDGTLAISRCSEECVQGFDGTVR